ncbi:MAG TPA: hypothetical protein EYQ50_02530 [Verrucomicrobiales bacterium]|nr:hypothetical protein [Verrucomicrobiales bacterium]HIL69460.1 hypothetical protein [Verrucomicrobiota bacterium]
MKDHESQYDPTILNLAETTFTKAKSSKFSFAVQFHELLPGQLLVSDVETRDDMLIVSAGHRVSQCYFSD